MSTRGREAQSPFRIEVRPMMEGSNPYQEDKFRKSNIPRELNDRAVLIETVCLYEGNVATARVDDRVAQIQSFVDIRTGFFSDREGVYHPFVHWGLKDASTGKDMRGYTDQGASVDPIYVFRVAKAFELLPHLWEDLDKSRQDRLDVVTAVQQAFFSFELEDRGKRKEMLERRRRIASIIGRDRLREILRMLPPRLEEMIRAMQERRISVMAENLERELKVKRLAPSRFYLDTIDTYHKDLEEIFQAFEKNGWAW